MKPWIIEETRLVLDRPWLRVHEESVRLPTGERIREFHRLETPSWAAVLVLSADGEAVLVEQHRRGLGRTSLELPAGVIDPGESALVAAQRELLEETGHVATDWRPLCELSPEPSRSTARAHLFFACQARQVAAPDPGAGEHLRVVRLPAAELIEAAGSGRMQHAVHVAGILLAAQRGWLPAAPL